MREFRLVKTSDLYNSEGRRKALRTRQKGKNFSRKSQKMSGLKLGVLHEFCIFKLIVVLCGTL